MPSNLERFQNLIFFPLLFILIPLWNIPHTIAGRYICEGLLLISVLAYKPNWKIFFSANKALLIFFAYLLIQFLFFSTNYQQAFSNFRAEWMHFILFSIIGAGVGLIYRERSSLKILLYLGIAFSIPLYIHLVLFAVKSIAIKGIPWAYWGINEIHGDLGYTSLQASVLLLTYFLFSSKKSVQSYWAILLIVPCILSPLVAMSRGGTLFSVIALSLTTLAYILIGSKRTFSIKKFCLVLTGIFLTGLIVFQVGLKAQPERWGGITSRISLGFEGKANDVFCNGTGYLEQHLKENGVSITPQLNKDLGSIKDGDGQRVIAARSGASLIAEYPMGINQSKQAYQQAIIEYCQKNPEIFISHAHNAWIDTALAIGIPGVILLMLSLLQYARQGYRAAARKSSNTLRAFGVALFTSALLWIIRGVFDSTMRDQMLEMQAFSFALLLGLVIWNPRDKSKTI
jgi:hypothetical protein